MKCTDDGNVPSTKAISRIVYLQSLSIISPTFGTFNWLVTVAGWSDLAASLKDSELVFLDLRTNS